VRNLGGGKAAIIAMHSGKAIDIRSGVFDDGRQLQQCQAVENHPNQTWIVTYTDGDTVRITTPLGDGTWAIGAQDFSAAPGTAAVLQQKANGNTNQAQIQRFVVEKIEIPLGYGTYERLDGIDVSSWQPANIGELVKYDFMIVKSTQGTWYENPNFSQQANSAFWSGRKLGVYHFADEGTDAKAEAKYFVSHVQGYIGKAILILDYEAGALNNGREWVRTFMREVKRLTGVTCGLYCSTYFIQSQRLDELCKDEGALLWNANYRYPSKIFHDYDQTITPGVPCNIYQYASTGRLPGYDKNLDLNVFYGTREDWDWFATH
jgi:GH25 family lysozyme M1 (1,4-beta-N-acetylmuramidase)